MWHPIQVQLILNLHDNPSDFIRYWRPFGDQKEGVRVYRSLVSEGRTVNISIFKKYLREGLIYTKDERWEPYFDYHLTDKGKKVCQIFSTVPPLSSISVPLLERKLQNLS